MFLICEFLYVSYPLEFCGLKLMDIWLFPKSTWSLDRQVTWRSRWGPSPKLITLPTLMVIGVVKLVMHLFAQIAWSNYRWVMWLDGCCQLNLSQILIKLVAIVLTEVEIKPFLHITLSHDQWFRWLGKEIRSP